MPYQAFPIYDFKSGLRLNKEPFMLPFDAFDVFENVYIDKGSIVKRKGLREIISYSNKELDDGYANSPANGEVDNGYSSSQPTNNFDGGHANANYNQSNNNPIVGFASLRDEVNNIYNYVFDTKNCYILDVENENLTLVASFLNCSKDDYVQCEKWRYKLFGTNNKDRPFWIKGNNWSFINVDFDNDNNNDVDRCSLVLEFKERLLLFSTTEKGTAYPQRIRWCKPNNPDDWTNDEYLDIPTSEIIISAQKLNDKIIIWCSNSVWALLYTGDPDIPFVVKCIAREIKTFGRMSAIVVEDKIFNISDTSIIVTDGVSFERLDVAIPRFFDETNRIKRKIIFGHHYKPLNQIWWAYCSLNSDDKDSILYFDYLNKIWGVYTIKTNVLGEVISKKNAPTWDSIDECWDNISWAWDDSTFQDELLLTLFGGYKGEISIGLDDYKDNDDPINFTLNSVNLNPYLIEGGIRRASLGWIDFYVDCANTNLIIDFFGEDNFSPVLTQKVNLLGSTQRKWIRVKYGGRYGIHRIRIRQDENSIATSVKIHAIVPYFKPLGKSREW